MVGEGGVIESIGEGEEMQDEFSDAQLEKIKGIVTEAITAALAPAEEVMEEMAKQLKDNFASVEKRVKTLEDKPAAEFKRQEKTEKKKPTLAEIAKTLK
jgi:predicted  nucleic acid-binding Zn-ribbon protein